MLYVTVGNMLECCQEAHSDMAHDIRDELSTLHAVMVQ